VFGIKIGRTYHIPASSVRPSDITCFFKKLSNDRGSSLKRLVVGLNHGEQTVELASQLTREEADWLMHDITEYLGSYAQPDVGNSRSSDLEMR
jgi:hypothetical protein